MTAKLGFGAKFFIHNGTTLTEVADIISVKPPSPTVDTVDTTVHGSAGGVREFIAGLVNTGEGSVKINYVPGSAGDLLLTSALASRAVKAWKINLPATTGTWDFTGNCVVTVYVVDDVQIDDKMTAVLSFKVSGTITQAAGA